LFLRVEVGAVRYASVDPHLLRIVVSSIHGHVHRDDREHDAGRAYEAAGQEHTIGCRTPKGPRRRLVLDLHLQWLVSIEDDRFIEGDGFCDPQLLRGIVQVLGLGVKVGELIPVPAEDDTELGVLHILKGLRPDGYPLYTM